MAGRARRARIVAAMLLAAASPAAAIAAKRIATLAPANPLAGAVRVGAASGGPAVRALVPPDIAAEVFDLKFDGDAIDRWFPIDYRPWLRANGLLATRPETARYELTATIESFSVTPLAGGSHAEAAATYHLVELASGRELWRKRQTVSLDVRRGLRWGDIGAAAGMAAGGALAGQPATLTTPLTVAAMHDPQRRVQPINVRLDVYEGLNRAFEAMAQETVTSLATFPTTAPGG